MAEISGIARQAAVATAHAVFASAGVALLATALHRAGLLEAEEINQLHRLADSMGDAVSMVGEPVDQLGVDVVRHQLPDSG